jgi:transcriptional regulator with XRE-family HTH domain
MSSKIIKNRILRNNLKTPGDRVRFLRGKKSRIEFAKILGYSPGYIRDIEVGRCQPSRNFLLSLNSKLNISINWVLYNELPILQEKKFYGGLDIIEMGRLLREKNLFHTPMEDYEREWLDTLYTYKDRYYEEEILFYYELFFPKLELLYNEKYKALQLKPKAIKIIDILKNNSSLTEEQLDTILTILKRYIKQKKINKAKNQ